ncbi:MAG: SnoK protein [Candidatus Binatia bacterium]|nr:MAG: SnoK protein [Candidatus Binatia bacterium]
MVLSEELRRAFAEAGFFRLERVFDESELSEMRSAYDEILAHPLLLGEQGKGKFQYSPLLHIQSPVLCRYATSPKLVGLAVELLGPDVRLYWDQAVSKPPGATSDVPWHQDNGYTAVDPPEYVTCTVALDDSTVENGCLWIQPGSHRHGVLAHRPTDFFFQVGYEGPATGVPVEARAGDVVVFSSLTLHRTGPNLSDRPRRSWVVQFCRADAKNAETGKPFDDRLLVARGGKVLREPLRERPFDLSGSFRGRSGRLPS